MDRSVARLNIQRYRQLLAEEIDEAKRALLQRLLAEEEAKLAGSQAADPPPKSDG